MPLPLKTSTLSRIKSYPSLGLLGFLWPFSNSSLLSCHSHLSPLGPGSLWAARIFSQNPNFLLLWILSGSWSLPGNSSFSSLLPHCLPQLVHSPSGLPFTASSCREPGGLPACSCQARTGPLTAWSHGLESLSSVPILNCKLPKRRGRVYLVSFVCPRPWKACLRISWKGESPWEASVPGICMLIYFSYLQNIFIK